MSCPSGSVTYAAPGLAVSQEYCLPVGVTPAVDLANILEVTGSSVLLAGAYGLYTLLPAWLTTASEIASGLESAAKAANCARCALEWFATPGEVTTTGPVDCQYGKQFRYIVQTARTARNTAAEFAEVMKGLGMEAQEVTKALNDGYVTLDQVQTLVSPKNDRYTALHCELRCVHQHVISCALCLQ